MKKTAAQELMNAPLTPDDIAYFDAFTEKCASYGVHPVQMMIKAGAHGMAARLLTYLIQGAGRAAGATKRVATQGAEAGGNLLKSIPGKLQKAKETFTGGYQQGATPKPVGKDLMQRP